MQCRKFTLSSAETYRLYLCLVRYSTCCFITKKIQINSQVLVIIYMQLAEKNIKVKQITHWIHAQHKTMEMYIQLLSISDVQSQQYVLIEEYVIHSCQQSVILANLSNPLQLFIADMSPLHPSISEQLIGHKNQATLRKSILDDELDPLYTMNRPQKTLNILDKVLLKNK